MNYKIGIIITLFCNLLIFISFIILYFIAFDEEVKTLREECYRINKGMERDKC